jgi:membrane protease YdiL (CAAX protease family)
MRRNFSETMQRLDLRLPTGGDIIWGLGTAFACLMFIFVVAGLMSLVLSPEMMEEQGAASEQIARAFGGSLLLVFLAAFSAAVGEEILFRGALQPVFGLIPTTLFFALLHSQYTFTPAAAMIIVVGGAMGWLKDRQSTTAAIIAHFVYNFIQLGIAYLYLQLEEAGLIPETVGFISAPATYPDAPLDVTLCCALYGDTCLVC